MVKVQINIINQLRLLRQSTFKDPLAFLDENVQNAQRARATQVNIETDSVCRTVTISNNGDVLDDPQKLFSMAESGWSDEVVKNENPFGIGFFSNISVSDYLVIYSGNKKIIFDVAHMLETGDTEIQVLENGNPDDVVDYPGFKIVLNNFDFGEIPEYQIEERAKLLGKFVQDVDIVYNGKIMERKDLTQIDSKSPFAISIEEPTCKGWVALATGFTNNVKLFYKGRQVTVLDKYYCEGEIHLSDSALNLTAPDRKDVIKDSKFYAFRQMIHEYIELIATEGALHGKQADLDTYSSAISWYADVNKAKQSMTFTIVRCDAAGIKYLRNIILRQDQPEDDNMGPTATVVDTNAVQSESQIEEVVVETEIVNAPKELTSSGGSNYFGPSLVEFQEQHEEEGSKLFAVDRPKFWVPISELHKYESKVLICKHYDICLVLARNKFQESVLTALEKDGQVFHIKTLDERIKVRVSLTNTITYKGEARAVMLFDMLSRMIGYDHNVFALGNLMVTRTLELPEINVSETRIEDTVQAIYCKDTDKVYVDRTLLKGVQLLEHTNPRLALSDYKFILANLPTFVQELAFTSELGPSKITGIILKTLGGE